MTMRISKVQIAVGVAFLVLLAMLVFRSISTDPELPIYWKLSDFELTNSDDAKVNLDSLAGHVWVANFIFTSCPGPCPLMSSKMRRLQARYSQQPGIKFVSITIDPETDTPEVLKKYAAKYSADTSQWLFLTGNRDEIVSLAQNGFKVGAGDANDPNLHTTKFILVDRDGNVRGFYDNDNVDFVPEIEAAIDTLL